MTDTAAFQAGTNTIEPPTTYLSPIRDIGRTSVVVLRANVDYLRILYNPGVRGIRRRKLQHDVRIEPPRERRDAASLDLLRADEFERNYAIRWLTAVIAQADTIGVVHTQSPDPSTHGGDETSDSTGREKLVEEAASLLAACAGTAASGRLARTSTFTDAVTRKIANVHIADAPLENSDWGTLGAQTWGAACVMAEMLFEEGGAEVFRLPLDIGGTRNKSGGRFRVLELGAGTGLVGIAVAKLLELRGVRADVCLTDLHPAVLSNLRDNVKTNFSTDLETSPDALINIDVDKLDWETFSKGHEEDSVLGTFDLILGADIVYEALHAEWLHSCLSRLLAANGLFHLLIPLRRTHSAESMTIKDVFERVSTNLRRARAETQPKHKLSIVGEEHFVCDAGTDSRIEDEVEYVYYRIGWVDGAL